MAGILALPTSFRPSAKLKKALTTYAEKSGAKSVSTATCELLEFALKMKAQESSRNPQKKALRDVLMDLFPGWSGQAMPDLGKPVQVQLKDGRDPLSLILDRRKK